MPAEGKLIDDALSWVARNHVRTLIACSTGTKLMVRLCDAGDPRTNRPHVDSVAYGATWEEASSEAMKGI